MCKMGVLYLGMEGVGGGAEWRVIEAMYSVRGARNTSHNVL